MKNSGPSLSSDGLGGGGGGGGGGGSISILPAPSIQLARSLASTSAEDLTNMSLYQLFEKQMESGSNEAALDAMTRLSVVAITLGAPSIQSEIIPYLTALVT